MSYSPYYGKSPLTSGGRSRGGVDPAAAITTVGFVASAATIYQNSKSISDLRKEVDEIKKKITDVSHLASSAESSAARSANSFKSLSQSFGSIMAASSASSSTPPSFIENGISSTQTSSETVEAAIKNLEEDISKTKNCVIEHSKKLNKRFDKIEGDLERLEASVLEIFERLERVEEKNLN